MISRLTISGLVSPLPKITLPRVTTDISEDTTKHLALKIVCLLLVLGLVWMFGEALAAQEAAYLAAARV